MKGKFILILRAALCVWITEAVAQTGPAGKPNIIVFMVDDMGWQDTSVPFWKEKTALNRRYHTPNMERLAREGMKFTSAYATPVCTPTRVSLLTGMNAARHRVTNWTSPERDKNTDGPDSTLQLTDWNINGFSPVSGVPHTFTSPPLPELLRRAGYHTIHVGKAHWGSLGTPGANPLNVGFTVNVGGHAAGHPQSYLGEENYGNMRGKTTVHAVPGLYEYYGSSTFLTEALTKEALKALEDPVANRRPFYLHLAHYAVHTPLQADQRFFEKYLKAGLDSVEARYASLIEGMDQSLGEVLDYLRKTGLEKNTILLFMSDNGGLSLVPPRGGSAHIHNKPLKGGKGSVYEGGIREPMLVKWPGVVKAGSVCDQYVIIEDFFPTLLEIAGESRPAGVDGISFLPYLKNAAHPKDAARALIWHYPNRWAGGSGPGVHYHSAVRKGEWKLIYNMKTRKAALYNLDKDIGEASDLAGAQPGKVKELLRVLSERLKAYNAQMPKYRTGGSTIPWPDES